MKVFLNLLMLCFFIPVYSLPEEEFDRFIEEAMTRSGVPGLSVVIVQEDKPIFLKGYGICKKGSPEKVNENTIFQLASVSKTFTAAGIAVLIDRKAINWDEEICKLFPEFILMDPYSTRYVNARDLLAHRTGLPAFGGDLLGQLGYTRAEVLARIRYITPETSFRNRAYYSNIGYFVAGELIEKISKNSFEKFIQDQFLTILRMNRSGFTDKLEKSSNVAFAHAEIDGKLEVIPWDRSQVLAAAGGLVSSAADMAQWMSLHLNQGKVNGKQLIDPMTLEQMHLPSMASTPTFSEFPPINSQSSFSFGLGWDNYNYQGKMIVEKAGALDGMRSIITLIPELRLGITVLSNLNLNILPELIRARFLEIFLGKIAVNLSDEIWTKSIEMKKMLDVPHPKEILPFKLELQNLIGQYQNELYGAVTVALEDKQLVIKAGPGMLRGELKPWSNDTFRLNWPLINSGTDLVTFTFGPSGDADSFSTEALGTFKRIEGRQ